VARWVPFMGPEPAVSRWFDSVGTGEGRELRPHSPESGVLWRLWSGTGAGPCPGAVPPRSVRLAQFQLVRSSACPCAPCRRSAPRGRALPNEYLSESGFQAPATHPCQTTLSPGSVWSLVAPGLESRGATRGYPRGVLWRTQIIKNKYLLQIACATRLQVDLVDMPCSVPDPWTTFTG
jgi:hypothetical protein